VFEIFPIKIPSSELLVNYLDRHIIDELLEGLKKNILSRVKSLYKR
jgi:hypothetical protein